MSMSLHYPYGEPRASGLLKASAADFIVDEFLGFSPSGEGEHLFLQIEKTGLSSFELIDRVANDFNLKPRDIGYSGLKDKQAVTRQWLSLYLPGQMRGFQMPRVSEYRILDYGWHNKKLKSGSHRANIFEVVIRDVNLFDDGSLQQIESIKNEGMANYFGQQRFGEQSDNVARAMQVFANPRKTRKLSRNKRSLYISALRSQLFNQILSRRIENGYWFEPVTGDVFMLAGSRSVFTAALDEEIFSRYREFDISSTASMAGEGDSQLTGPAKMIEDEVFAENADLLTCLCRLKVKQQMRPLRVRVQGLEVEHDKVGNTLTIRVKLPRGSYFTTLLNHFVETRQGS